MKPKNKIALQVVFCGGLAFFCSFIDRLAWPPVIPVAAKELGLNGAQAGGFMSAFFLGYLLTQLPGGILADRLGTRKVLLFSLVIMGLFTLLMSQAQDFSSGILLRFFAGLGSGGVLAAAVKGVYDYFEPRYRATAMGFLMASGPLGLLTANLAAPVLAARLGWRYSFVFAGLFTLLSWLMARQLLPAHQSSPTLPPSFQKSQRQEFWAFLANKQLIITAAAGFFAMWGTWGTLTWANAYMHQGLGLSLQQSGQAMALFALGALMGQPLVGWISDQFPRKRRQTGMIILGLFSVLLWLFGNNQEVKKLLFLTPLLGAGAFIFGPVLNTYISELMEGHQVATAIGFCNGIWQLGSLISPVAAGALLDYTGYYSWAFAVLAAGPMIAVFLLATVGAITKKRGLEEDLT